MNQTLFSAIIKVFITRYILHTVCTNKFWMDTL